MYNLLDEFAERIIPRTCTSSECGVWRSNPSAKEALLLLQPTSDGLHPSSFGRDQKSSRHLVRVGHAGSAVEKHSMRSRYFGLEGRTGTLKG